MKRVLVAVLLLLGCKRQPVQSPATLPIDHVAILKAALERMAHGAETHECGPAAAERLRTVIRILDKGGPQAFDGQCEIYCSFSDKGNWVPAGLTEIQVEAVMSGSFHYQSVEVLDANGQLLGTTQPEPTMGTFGAHVPGIDSFGTEFYIKPATDPAKERMVDVEPILPLSTTKGLQVRLLSASGQRSNAVSVMEPKIGNPDSVATATRPTTRS